MPKGTSPLPGQWRTLAYQREIMDCFNNPEILEVVFQKSTQVGASEMLNNIIGFCIDVDPSAILMVRPTSDNAKDYGRKTISPMINNCPPLKAKVREAKSREGGNTLKHKEYPGGYLKLAGANSGADLRSDGVPRVLLDEVDGYPLDVDGEGDPVQIVKRRMDSYAGCKLFMMSTPAKATGTSRIETAYLLSDMRRYYVPCPLCGFMQHLRWRDPDNGAYRLIFSKDGDGNLIPESVAYLCAGCSKPFTEHRKQGMIDSGKWVAERPERAAVGFHINAFYSPWKDTWTAMAKEWIEAQGDNELLRAFINLRLGETFREHGDEVSVKGLLARVEKYPCDLPAGVGVLTLSVDTQDNRIECVVKGWGAGEESWLIAHEIFWGDPGAGGAEIAETVWNQLEKYRQTEFTTPSGRRLKIAITVIDSGGHHAEAVYAFTRPRQNRTHRCFAVKGVEFHAKPVLVQESPIKRNTARLFTIATSPAKDRMFSRLRLLKPGPGFMHFPDWTTEEYCAQLTAESKISVVNKKTGKRKYEWVNSHGRNEALDCEIYAMGALAILQGSLGIGRDLAAAAAEAALPPPPGTPPYSAPPASGMMNPTPALPSRKPGGFVNNW